MVSTQPTASRPPIRAADARFHDDEEMISPGFKSWLERETLQAGALSIMCDREEVSRMGREQPHTLPDAGLLFEALYISTLILPNSGAALRGSRAGRERLG